MTKKVAVYAICKNEEHNIADWLACTAEADFVFMLDTGSDDDTINKVKTSGYENVDIIEANFVPFAFNTARNMSLNVAARRDTFDIMVFLDLDERLPAGWSDAVRAALETSPNIHSIYFNMQLTDSDGSPSTRYRQLKAHSPEGYQWRYRAHEVLVNTLPDREGHTIQLDITISHHKDETKPRNYIHLLADDFKDMPNDHRACFYYGRELYYIGEYQQALAVLLQTYQCKEGYFDAQQVEALRIMFYCSGEDSYLMQALLLNRDSRETLYDWAIYMRDSGQYFSAIGLVEMMFNIRETDNFILFKDQGVWSWKPYDLLAECFWQVGNVVASYENAKTALSMNPNNKRLQDNMSFYTAPTVEKEDNEG